MHLKRESYVNLLVQKSLLDQAILAICWLSLAELHNRQFLVKSSNPCNPPSQIFLKFLSMIEISMSVQNTSFQSDTVYFGFMAC